MMAASASVTGPKAEVSSAERDRGAPDRERISNPSSCAARAALPMRNSIAGRHPFVRRRMTSRVRPTTAPSR